MVKLNSSIYSFEQMRQNNILYPDGRALGLEGLWMTFAKMADCWES